MYTTLAIMCALIIFRNYILLTLKNMEKLQTDYDKDLSEIFTSQKLFLRKM